MTVTPSQNPQVQPSPSELRSGVDVPVAAASEVEVAASFAGLCSLS
ncbi:hypothetical protein GGQ21_003249 [Salinibacter ruber]|nr:hypothetical protein [Salinibacter ruber]MCS3672578.1 hypothetical protein [Salinibacter ruber]